jgi:hypothetical protein
MNSKIKRKKRNLFSYYSEKYQFTFSLNLFCTSQISEPKNKKLFPKNMCVATLEFLLLLVSCCSSFKLGYECPKKAEDMEIRFYFLVALTDTDLDDYSIIYVNATLVKGYQHAVSILSNYPNSNYPYTKNWKKKICLQWIGPGLGGNQYGPRTPSNKEIGLINCISTETIKAEPCKSTQWEHLNNKPCTKSKHQRCDCTNCMHFVGGVLGPYLEKASFVERINFPELISVSPLRNTEYDERQLGKSKPNEVVGCPKCFRVSAGNSGMTLIFINMMKQFGWSKAVFMYDYRNENDTIQTKATLDKAVPIDVCAHQGASFIAEAAKEGIHIKDAKVTKIHNITETLLNVVGDEYAIVFLCGHPSFIEKIMKIAQFRGFTDKGEYVFVDVLNMRDEENVEYPWIVKPINGLDPKLLKTLKEEKLNIRPAFESVMHLTYDPSSHFKKHKSLKGWNWVGLSLAKFLVVFAQTWGKYDVSPCKDDRLYSFQDYKSQIDQIGIWFEDWYKSKTRYVSFSGQKFFMDEHGNLLADVALMSFNTKLHKFRVAQHYVFTAVKKFDRKIVDSSILFPKWQSVKGNKGEYPPEKPGCGFDNRNCNPLLIICAVSCSLLFVAGLFLLGFRKQIWPSKREFHDQVDAKWIVIRDTPAAQGLAALRMNLVFLVTID